jgi:hypothetical protein
MNQSILKNVRTKAPIPNPKSGIAYPLSLISMAIFIIYTYRGRVISNTNISQGKCSPKSRNCLNNPDDLSVTVFALKLLTLSSETLLQEEIV